MNDYNLWTGLVVTIGLFILVAKFLMKRIKWKDASIFFGVALILLVVALIPKVLKLSSDNVNFNSQKITKIELLENGRRKYSTCFYVIDSKTEMKKRECKILYDIHYFQYEKSSGISGTCVADISDATLNTVYCDTLGPLRVMQYFLSNMTESVEPIDFKSLPFIPKWFLEDLLVDSPSYIIYPADNQ